MGCNASKGEKQQEKRPSGDANAQQRFEETGEVDETPSEIEERKQRERERIKRRETAKGEALARLKTSRAQTIALKNRELRVSTTRANLGLGMTSPSSSGSESSLESESSDEAKKSTK